VSLLTDAEPRVTPTQPACILHSPRLVRTQRVFFSTNSKLTPRSSQPIENRKLHDGGGSCSLRYVNDAQRAPAQSDDLAAERRFSGRPPSVRQVWLIASESFNLKYFLVNLPLCRVRVGRSTPGACDTVTGSS
jgi:hypothetical protein